MLDGSDRQVTLSGEEQTRLFEVGPGGCLTLLGLTVANGSRSGANGVLGQPGQSAEAGAILLTNGRLHATNCVFKRNGARAGAGGNRDTSGYAGLGGSARGGAILASPGVVALESCTFQSCWAYGGHGGATGSGFQAADGTGSGGAIAVAGGSLTLIRCSFEGSYAAPQGDGGAISCAPGTLHAEGCIFESNHASLGGAIHAGGSQANVMRCRFLWNRASDGFPSRGGAVGSTADQLNVADCHFTFNAADGRPGSIVASARYDAGHGQGGAVATLAGNALITRCSFTSNSVTGGDGMPGFTASARSASAAGGAVYNEATLSLVNCTFAANSAKAGGNYPTWSPLHAVGGALASSNGLMTVEHCTIAGNWTTYTNNPSGGLASGGGCHAGGGAVHLKSSILESNSLLTAAPAGPSWQLQNASGPGFIDLGYNLSSDATPGFSTAGSANNTSAMLLPLARNGGSTLTMALAPNSPAVDAGDPNDALSTDQRLIGRPFGARHDIGAFERGVLPQAFELHSIRTEPVQPALLQGVGTPTQVFAVERSEDLVRWTRVTSGQVRSDGTFSLLDPSTGPTRGFFRTVTP